MPWSDNKTLANKNYTDEDLLIEIKNNFRIATEAESENREEALDDLRFLYEDGAQWPDEEKNRRQLANRQCLQINILQKYCKQVAGEMRQNKVRSKVSPSDSKSDINIAQILESKVYDIEYQSNYEAVYNHAGQMMIDCGYGAWRILTRKNAKNPFTQDIYFEPIENPLNVYPDPNAKNADFSDSEYKFIINRIGKAKFKRQYNKTDDVVSNGALYDTIGTGDNEGWIDDDSVQILEYYYKEYYDVEMALMNDGRILTKEEALKEIETGENALKQGRKIGEVEVSAVPKILKTDVVTKYKIILCECTCHEILKKSEWGGKYIPIVLGIGERTNIGGKTQIKGLIRNAKDSQRMLNYWHTAAAETIALAPKAPVIMTPKMIAKYEKSWVKASTDNVPYLLHNPDPQAPYGPKPSPQPQPPVALFSEISRAEENVKSSLGMYNTDVGDQGRELSGTAIIERQKPGDRATYVYMQNLAQAIAYSSKIIVDIIPVIHDTEQDMRIRQDDGTETFVPVNTTASHAAELLEGEPEKYAGINGEELKKKLEGNTLAGNADYNKLTTGDYNVVVSTGPAYQTQREMAADNLIKIAMAGANMQPLDKYYAVASLDSPDAQEYAESIRKTIPFGVLTPKPGEKPPEPPKPSPVEQMQLEIAMKERDNQTMKGMVEQQRLVTEEAKQKKEALKIQLELREHNVKIDGDIAKLVKELSEPATNNAGNPGVSIGQPNV